MVNSETGIDTHHVRCLVSTLQDPQKKQTRRIGRELCLVGVVGKNLTKMGATEFRICEVEVTAAESLDHEQGR